LALDTCAQFEKFQDWRIIVQSSFVCEIPKLAALYSRVTTKLQEYLVAQSSREIITIEDSIAPGVLFPLVSKLVLQSQSAIRVQSVALLNFGYSFRSLQETLEFFEFTPARVASIV
jgi:hypothetical protein